MEESSAMMNRQQHCDVDLLSHRVSFEELYSYNLSSSSVTGSEEE